MAGGKHTRRRFRVHSDPDATADNLRPCARGRYCVAATFEIVEGETIAHPKMGPRTFCDMDRDNIRRRLENLPELYLRLHMAIGEPGQGTGGRHGKPEPRLPIRIDIDAQQRQMTEWLCSWEARVRRDASLTPLDLDHARRRPGGRSVADAVALLGKHLDTLLGLAPERMTRHVSLPIRAEILERMPDAVVVRPGDAKKGDTYGLVEARLDGAWAGHEILDMDYRANRTLGLTKQPPVRLRGVPCRNEDCDLIALRRADPADHDDDIEYWSECTACGDKMTRDEYDQWVKRYANYAEGRAVV